MFTLFIINYTDDTVHETLYSTDINFLMRKIVLYSLNIGFTAVLCNGKILYTPKKITDIKQTDRILANKLFKMIDKKGA